MEFGVAVGSCDYELADLVVFGLDLLENGQALERVRQLLELIIVYDQVF